MFKNGREFSIGMLEMQDQAAKYFFQNYKTGQSGKWSKVASFKGERTARRLIEKSQSLFP